MRRAIRWFAAFVLVFLLTGVAGELFFPEANFPSWFPSTMLALNIIGAGAISFTLLASFRSSAMRRWWHCEPSRNGPRGSSRTSCRVRSRALKAATGSIADHVEAASILFADVVDFTPFAQRLSPAEVVGTLDHLFSHFDTLVERHGLEKIKTIGDCYMAAAGVPDPCADHATRAAFLALDIQAAVSSSAIAGQDGLRLRIGINSGPVTAGVIGTKRFLYDLWGDAVNTASRMESNGSPGEIQITRTTYELLKDEFVCRSRGTIEVKERARWRPGTWKDRARTAAEPTRAPTRKRRNRLNP